MRTAGEHADVVSLPVPCVEGCLAIGGDDVRAEPYRDGPVLVRDAECILRPDGSVLPIRRSVVALCRCGRSRLGVHCDGTHRLSSRSPKG
ncbi:MAG: CDGSH iron-sulfur domain-containing protein [Actinomycetota bacterium]